MSKKQKTEYVAVGGQALMEGIMMRGPKGTAMSLRLPDGSIETQMKDFVSLRRKHKILNIPIIRGVIAFVESMVFGYKLLMESAEKTSLDTAMPMMSGIISSLTAIEKEQPAEGGEAESDE